ncbi:MAG: hypothetical protein JW772_01445 [Candidatus Diapherotrites archaeon]|nr:hypothetical protein [Candidatus Diapherotrites archaeon]
MAEASDPLSWVERRISGVANYLSAGISRFVAFLFFLFGIGAFFGAFVYTSFPKLGIYLIVAPLLLGLIAYYNKTVAIVLFIVFLIFLL